MTGPLRVAEDMASWEFFARDYALAGKAIPVESGRELLSRYDKAVAEVARLSGMLVAAQRDAAAHKAAAAAMAAAMASQAQIIRELAMAIPPVGGA